MVVEVGCPALVATSVKLAINVVAMAITEPASTLATVRLPPTSVAGCSSGCGVVVAANLAAVIAVVAAVTSAAVAVVPAAQVVLAAPVAQVALAMDRTWDWGQPPRLLLRRQRLATLTTPTAARAISC